MHAFVNLNKSHNRALASIDPDVGMVPLRYCNLRYEGEKQRLYVDRKFKDLIRAREDLNFPLIGERRMHVYPNEPIK
jgi:hypothetical protein